MEENEPDKNISNIEEIDKKEKIEEKNEYNINNGSKKKENDEFNEISGNKYSIIQENNSLMDSEIVLESNSIIIEDIKNENKIKKDEKNEEVKIQVCNSHEGEKFSYCKTCKSILCENCIMEHNKANHYVKSAIDIATEYKKQIEKIKKTIGNRAKETLSILEATRNALLNNIDKAFSKFETEINSSINIIRENTKKNKAEIYSEFEMIAKNLIQDSMCNEYNFELGIVNTIHNSDDQSSIVLLNKDAINTKHQKKMQQMNDLIKVAENMEKKSHKFIKEWEGIEECLEVITHSSINKLIERYKENMEKIRNSNHELYEATQQLSRKMKQIIEVEKELEALKVREKEKNEILTKLTKQHDRLKADMNAIKEQSDLSISIINKSETQMLHYISEINSLKEVITLKEEYYNTLSMMGHKKNNNTLGFKELLYITKADIIYCLDKEYIISYVYPFEEKEFIKSPLSDFGIYSFCACVQFKNDFYVSGGCDMIKLKLSKTLTKLYIDKKKINAECKNNMNIEKYHHKMVILNLFTIYSLCGKSKDKKFLNTCERYSMLEDKWEMGPNLHEGKINIGVTSVNTMYIYVFGGTKENSLSTIEMLDTTIQKLSWKLIKLADSKIWTPRSEVGCFQLNETEVFIFGGSRSSSGSIDEVLIFNYEKRTMTKHKEKLLSKDWFNGVNPIRIGDNLICVFGSLKNYLHTLLNKKMTWSLAQFKY